MNRAGATIDKGRFPFVVTDTAVNPARVTPAANGCCNQKASLVNKMDKAFGTYPWDTQLVLISDMYIFDSDLKIVDDFGG